MPLPLLFIGIAAVTGAIGVGATTKAGLDHEKAKAINSNAADRIEEAATRLETYRKQCAESLENLGAEKVFILENSMTDFVNTFSKIKNVDFTESVGMDELKEMHIDKKEFDDIDSVSEFVLSVSGGVLAGITGGALVAFGAYSAAATFATASTGTAIATLSGAAASNATLAFFGGGALAAGGLGVAGGTAILGGLVAGPAIMVMGIIFGATAGKKLEEAKMNAAEANVACEQMETGALQCVAVRRRTDMFYGALAKLDATLLPLIHDMQEIIENEGYDYRLYKPESKKKIACAATTAVTVKAVLDTPILSEDGSLTKESELACTNADEAIKTVRKMA